MRDKILKILLDNKDEFISGESMSERLEVTRAAVWKHIKTLQSEGFKIESVSRKGYRLVGLPDKLERVTLLHGMETKALGRTVEIHEFIDSTNSRAKELALLGYPEGTLVVAEEQLKGRGRMGRSWISPAGKGIWMSLLLRPKIPPSSAPIITSLAALAVKRALEEVAALKASIKWPNDIILQNKKVCGILTEIHADIDIIHYVILGIGINANLDKEDFPKELLDSATSISIVLGRKVDRTELVQAIMKHMEDIYTDYIKKGDIGSILDECRKCSATLGRTVKVIGRDREFSGKAVDLDEDGALLVLKEDGEMEKVLSGDVSVRGIGGYV